ncbi:hypothetical protein ACKVV1_011590 [Pyricularia oryzae]
MPPHIYAVRDIWQRSPLPFRYLPRPASLPLVLRASRTASQGPQSQRSGHRHFQTPRRPASCTPTCAALRLVGYYRLCSGLLRRPLRPIAMMPGLPRCRPIP